MPIIQNKSKRDVQREPTMKIDNRLQNLITPVAMQKKTGVKPQEGVQKTSKQPTAAFSLELSAAVEQMKATPSEDEIRLDRVEAIRNQLAAGTYNISGTDVANKILKALKS
jgi:flagellar biosynthesis anti-sigma factor FlgM